ncbi:MAG: hypothetical protein ACOX6Q_03125 [Candidatus Dojkabacteria bacterium]
MKRSGVRLSSGPFIIRKRREIFNFCVQDVMYTSTIEVGPIIVVKFIIFLVAHLKLNRK